MVQFLETACKNSHSLLRDVSIGICYSKVWSKQVLSWSGDDDIAGVDNAYDCSEIRAKFAGAGNVVPIECALQGLVEVTALSSIQFPTPLLSFSKLRPMSQDPR